MSRHETRAAIVEAAADFERLRAQHREQMQEECLALPFPWKWIDAGPEIVMASTGAVTLALTGDGELRLEGLRDRGYFDTRLLDIMRAQLAAEQRGTLEIPS